MTRNIYVQEAVHNGARSLRDEERPVRVADTTLAARNLAVAQRRCNEKAEAFWAEVLRFCKAKEEARNVKIIVITT